NPEGGLHVSRSRQPSDDPHLAWLVRGCRSAIEVPRRPAFWLILQERALGRGLVTRSPVALGEAGSCVFWRRSVATAATAPRIDHDPSFRTTRAPGRSVCGVVACLAYVTERRRTGGRGGTGVLWVAASPVTPCLQRDCYDRKLFGTFYAEQGKKRVPFFQLQVGVHVSCISEFEGRACESEIRILCPVYSQIYREDKEMNVHAQVAGHVPSQAGPQPPGLAPQNASALPPQMQSLGTISNMDPEMYQHRRQMCDRITQIFHSKRPNAEFLQRLPDLVRRLEERLFRTAFTKDDYLNMDTLESRLHAILKGFPSSQSPAHSVSSSSPVSTMIPTPGMSHGNGSNTAGASSLDNSISNSSGSGNTAPTTLIASDMMSSANGSLPSGYRQTPVNVSAGSSGNNVLSSRVAPQLSSQMIPTPGLNVQQSMPMNSEYGNNGGRFSGVQSTILSHQQQQWNQPQRQQSHQQEKPCLENQSSGMLHGIRTNIGADMRSDVQQRPSSYRSSNGIVNGGTALVGTSAQIMNGPVTSDGYLSTTAYGASPRPLQKHLEQQQHQPIVSGSSSQQVIPVSRDGYGVNAAELSGPGNPYGSAATVGSMINSQSLNAMNLQSKNKMYPLQGDRQNLQLMQQISHAKPPSLDQSQKINFHSVHTTRDHLQPQQKMQKFQQPQFQQQPNQPYGQFVQLQQQKQIQKHQQHLLKSDSLRQSALSSNFEGQLASDCGINSCPEPLLTQVPEQFPVSEFQCQYQLNSAVEDHSKGTFIHFSEPLDFNLSFTHGSQQMQQIFRPQPQCSEPRNEFNSLSISSQSESLLEDQWHPQAVPKSQTLDASSFDQHFQEDFHQRITGQDEAQRPHFSSEGSITSHAAAATSMMAPQLAGGGCGPQKSLRERQYLNQQRWLLFLRHARCCPSPKGKCQEVNCATVQHLLSHMRSCKVDQCGYPRCCQSKALIKHYHSCRAGDCPVCVPVRVYTTKQRKLSVHPPSDAVSVNSVNVSRKTMDGAGADRSVQNRGISAAESSEDLQSSFKRMKVDRHSSLIAKSESHSASASLMNLSHSSQEVKIQGHQQVSIPLTTKMEIVELKTESLMPSELQNFQNMTNSNMDDSEDVYGEKPDSESILSELHDTHTKTESMQIDAPTDQASVDVKLEASAPVANPVAGTKLGKPKIKGVSMTELFTPDQIREHIVSLRQWVGQSKVKAEKNQAMERSMSENSCQLCAVEKLTFDPPPIYCSLCGARIKRNATYYTIGTGDARQFFCIPCYNEARGDSIEVEGSICPKSKLEKKKNDEETEEWWVQCDKCEAWQHQICALFNGRRNDGEAEYTCPNCYVKEVERGERMPLPQSAVLGAKDLPRTLLSDHIEHRLFKRLKHERQERARHLGKSIDEVPGAEALVVRVVSSVDKKLEVKQRFLEMFQEKNYPTEFPYKSKVVLLFQKIEGVEVCLFGMYVQEFGSECPFPNQRRVYLSYLDSVKYFRPEIKTITGEALRTFVYHEILIGYLEYCKKRGFTSCYIWACPPLKGEDYILYCHPEIQKTPKSDKLREWYLSMLRKATKEDIVVDLTNLYDHFFVRMGECKGEVTATRLPYFDGDYWPGAAEDMINQLQQEEDGRKQQKKGKTKKIITKRSLKATCQADLSNASKDTLLMQKLGDTIVPMKEDFIMVHLQHACSHCCMLMVSGTRWVCNQCYNTEQRCEDRERHPVGSREKHLLRPVEISDVAVDTKDKDEIVESEFFDTRQAFLSLCQGNHYQYDTLRRAKHSSMMVLFHLHNPTEPAFVTSCNVCQRDVEAGRGWRCEVCPDFDVCNKCYERDGGVDHPHRLTNHPSSADRDAQNKEARQKRVVQLRKMLDLLVHASQCRSVHCQYPNCRRVKGLFRHGITCTTRASGGCYLCKKMWYLLQLHARACKESPCHVPRCRDLREHLRRLQQQSDSRRRAAVMEMMRQRAAEVAGNGG
ncbi:hypothetical protein Taro_049762, partial [Colocasia esculenta]|nr:hypothetical protein [Colocasia esculenta]